MGTKTDNGHIVEHMPQGVYTSMCVYVYVTVSEISETERESETGVCASCHSNALDDHHQLLVIQLIVLLQKKYFSPDKNKQKNKALYIYI